MWRLGLGLLPAAAALVLLTAGTCEGPPTAGEESATGTEASRLPTRETGPPLRGVLKAASIGAGGGGGAISEYGAVDPVLSADGAWLVLESSSTDLVMGQHAGRPDFHQPQLFLHDRTSHGTVLVSHSLGDPTQAGVYKSWQADISADGRWVAYESSSYDLVPPPGGGRGRYPNEYPNQIYLFDRQGGTNVLISHDAGGAPAAGGSHEVSISADGRWTAYGSSAPDLVDGQVDGRSSGDVFLYDRESGESVLVSHAAGNKSTVADDQSDAPSISADGRFVAYVSLATDLVPGQDDANGAHDLFVYDRERGETMLVSRAGGSPTTACEYGVANEPASVGDDGRFVAYVSASADLVPGLRHESGDNVVFLFDRQTGESRLVSHAARDPLMTGMGIAEAASVSGDGNWVVYASEADDLVAGQTGEPSRNVYLWQRASGVNRLVSHRAGSTLAAPSENSFEPAISRNGRYVAFVSDAPDLMPGQVDEEMGGFDIFLYDRETAAVTLVSHLAGRETAAVNGADTVSISADGTVVSFASTEDGLVPEDANGEIDVYWFGLG